MIDAPLALAFASGVVAAVNPCGFAMLPAYVGFFLGTEGDRVPTKGESVLRAIPVSLAVSLGFLFVFGMVGIALRPVSSTVQEYAPQATMVIGVGLVAFGLATVAGFELSARIPKLNRGGRERGLWSMFLYGVSYAIASLTCTIGIFLSVVVGTFSRTNFVSGVSMLLLYAAGMGVVVMALTVAIALARDSVVRFLRSGMQYVNRVAGVLMVIMGAYLTWYGIFALRVREDATTAAGPADTVERWSADVSNWIRDFGATRFGLVLLGATVSMVCISVLVSSLRSDDRADDAGAATDDAGADEPETVP